MANTGDGMNIDDGKYLSNDTAFCLAESWCIALDVGVVKRKGRGFKSGGSFCFT
jgi:hypothetical protein